MIFETSVKEVLGAFDKWHENETKRITEQLSFTATVHATAPGIGRIFAKITDKITAKVDITIGES